MPDMEVKYAIIGAGAAGMAAVQAIRERDPHGSIAVFSAESDPPYFRPLIPFLISGRKDEAAMRLMGAGPYPDTAFELRLNSRVESLDVNQKKLTLADGSAGYEKLLLATGSRPYRPPEIKNLEARGVFAVRTLADARAAAQRCGQTDRAIMLGGGLLNLKVAFALLERNIKATLAVQSPEVLSQLMEPADADLIRLALNNAGLDVMTGVSAAEIVEDGDGVCAVTLRDGRELPCQMVCLGKGVVPGVGFLNPDQVNLDGGVVVDSYTKTSAADVYAAGDAAVYIDPASGDRVVTGLWTNAVEMGRCAGFNMAGKVTEYSGAFGILNATQVADQPFVSMGVVHTAGTDCETIIKKSKNAYRKMVFSPDGTKLVGVVLVGDIDRAGLYRFLIREGAPVGKLKKRIVDHTLHYGHLMNRR